MIRTRFAPSPTGEPHIGNIRSALFAYLFAKHNDGQFLLRIEDTDRDRFVPGATERIIEALQWLGIVPDNLNHPVIQSERKEIYKQYALQLVEKGAAYVCDCTKERLDELRQTQEAQKLPPGYDAHCRGLNLSYHEGCTIRLKMPDSGKIVVNDLIRGKVEFDAALLDDPIILKSDGFPTYHLAVVIDDHEMGITHTIRAEEWLPSTPKHLVLYGAFGWQPTEFAHLPMILGPDRKKLSKRHGATAVLDYRQAGYLPEAIVNFIALLGWNPKDEREDFTLDQLVKEFTLENVNKAPAVFNIDKLNNINEKYIRQQNNSLLLSRLAEYGIADLTAGEIALIKRGGYQTLNEVANCIASIRQLPSYDPSLLIFKKSDKDKTKTGLSLAREKLENQKDWDPERLQQVLQSIPTEHSLTNGDVFWPIRVALSGAEKSPSPAELLFALGKNESLARINQAVASIEKL